MHPLISDELKEFIDSVRAFRLRELMPLEQQFLLDGGWTPEVRNGLEERARKLGFWALDVPVEDGGQGLDELAMCLVAEELYQHPGMFEFGGSPEPALYFCNEEQKKEYYYPVIAGQRRSAYAFTEPDTGSDFARITTTAKRDGDDWIINGRKMFISHLDRADFIILFVSTDPSAGARGVSCFLVDKDTPGLDWSRPIRTMGDDWTPHEIIFDNCRVPGANLLGELNGGFAIANHQLTHGRIRIAAYQLGIAQRSLDLAVEWAKVRTTWGKPIATRQAIQWMIADSYVELEAARGLVYTAAAQFGRTKADMRSAFVAKLYATEMAQRVTDRCMQIFGGLGYALENPIQSFFRQVRLWRIGHGTSEIHRWMIARDILGLSANA